MRRILLLVIAVFAICVSIVSAQTPTPQTLHLTRLADAPPDHMPISDVKFSPDGTSLIGYNSHLNTVRSWNLKTGEAYPTLNTADGTSRVVFSADSQQIGIVPNPFPQAYAVQIVDLRTGTAEQTLSLQPAELCKLYALPCDSQPSSDHPQITGFTALDAAFSRDGHWLALAGWLSLDDGQVHIPAVTRGAVILYDLQTQQFHGLSITTTDAYASRLRFSPDSQQLAFVTGVQSSDCTSGGFVTLNVWDIAADQPVNQWNDLIGEFAFQPGSPRLAVNAGVACLPTPEPGVKLWDTQTSEKTMLFPSGQVSPLVFSPDGRYLLAGAAQTILVWDTTMQTARALYQLDFEFRNPPMDFAFDGATVHIAVGGYDGSVWMGSFPMP